MSSKPWKHFLRLKVVLWRKTSDPQWSEYQVACLYMHLQQWLHTLYQEMLCSLWDLRQLTGGCDYGGRKFLNWLCASWKNTAVNMWQSLSLSTRMWRGEQLWCKSLNSKFGNRSPSAKGLRRWHEKWTHLCRSVLSGSYMNPVGETHLPWGGVFFTQLDDSNATSSRNALWDT